MDIHSYTILALIGRYILIILCFFVFVEALIEIRKIFRPDNPPTPATIRWKRKRINFDLLEENIVGRGNGCDIVIKAPSVKRRQFRLYSNSGEWIIVPYKKSEIYLNDYLVEEKMKVEDGDRISFGRENIIFNIVPENDEEMND